MDKRREKAVKLLNDLFSKHDYSPGTRLPPERTLCTSLGISRSALREAFEIMEAGGRIWRRVGKGTFFGGPPENHNTKVIHLLTSTSPSEIMEARSLIEPRIARSAALKATDEEIAKMTYYLKKSMKAHNEQTHDKWDQTLHMAIVKATKNNILIAVCEAINEVRNQSQWRGLGKIVFTPARISGYHQQHTAIVEAIANRSPERAERFMQKHLEAVKQSIMDAETAITD